MREMKDSGIEWVGEIPSNWTVMQNKYVMKKLKHICTKYTGQNILSLTIDGVIVRDLNAGGKMPATFDGYQYIIQGNLLMCLFDYDVTPRCIGLINNDGLTSPAYSQFTLINGNIPKYYFYYYLMIDHTKALLHLAKNLRHSFTEDQLGNILTPVPPLSEQQKIADFLDQKCFQIDTLRADIEKQIQILEEYKKSVITEAVTKGLNPNVEMKESGIEWIGMIPKDWRESRLEYECYVRARLGWRGLKATEYVDTGYAFISAFNIQDGKLVWHPLNFITKQRFEESPEIKIREGDILLVKDGAGVGKCARVDSLPCGEAAPNSSIAVISCFNKVEYEYLTYYLQSNIFQNIVLQLYNGMGVPHLTQEILSKIRFPVPPLKEQNIIANYLDKKSSNINSIISTKKQQLESLNSYKKSLIYEYVTGKKEVI